MGGLVARWVGWAHKRRTEAFSIQHPASAPAANGRATPSTSLMFQTNDNGAWRPGHALDDLDCRLLSYYT